MGKLETGKAAPSFTLPADNGNDISLSDYKGKKSDFIFLSER